MAQAKPPEPSPRNFPFHAAAGIHTSKLMWDCGVGVAKAATRQKAGRFGKTSPSAAMKVPAGTDCAAVMVTFGKERPAKPAQVAAIAGLAPAATDRAMAAASSPRERCVFMRFPPRFANEPDRAASSRVAREALCGRAFSIADALLRAAGGIGVMAADMSRRLVVTARRLARRRARRNSACVTFSPV